ncbi:MAG: hypothetical protein A4E42_00370 [Methanoregulaceae archaeon PtaU1.Bin222]|nr:MAG: hypothetical protein A4E42_00370 [Methanoregulaceae archaeon PtaU1.Bin222]
MAYPDLGPGRFSRQQADHILVKDRKVFFDDEGTPACQDMDLPLGITRDCLHRAGQPVDTEGPSRGFPAGICKVRDQPGYMAECILAPSKCLFSRFPERDIPYGSHERFLRVFPVAEGDCRDQGVDNGSVLPPQPHGVLFDKTLPRDDCEELVPLQWIRVELRDRQRHQFVPGRVPEHLERCIVEVQPFPFRGRDEHRVPRCGEELPVPLLALL